MGDTSFPAPVTVRVRMSVPGATSAIRSGLSEIADVRTPVKVLAGSVNSRSAIPKVLRSSAGPLQLLASTLGGARTTPAGAENWLYATKRGEQPLIGVAIGV